MQTKTDITFNTRVAALLDAYPQLEAVLTELSPVFAKLKNPVLRRTVAKVATLQQAAQTAGIEPGSLVQALRKAAGLTSADVEEVNAAHTLSQRPDWFREEAIVSRFNATEVIETGGSPMQGILQVAYKLKGDETLQVDVPFQPVPIIDLLQSKGFLSWYDGKQVFFRRQ